ncbi:VWA domain-containing protein [Roseibium sp. MMSF_3412]|uniref:VWA domain-containing protein n=1 Tax=Roseibium sp. MMSF_3412 TaxID=3046712 RepID=UPI00273D64F7|nr:VWA domain-containing protein [Roseibium sp. MMSF_3412]
MTFEMLMQNLSQFHFLRPWWLLALLGVGGLWWVARFGSDRDTELPSVIAPHLAAALTIGADKRRMLRPVDTVALVLTLLVLASAGPTWSRQANPLVSDEAPLVIALKVSESMMEPDVPPTRLERAKHKILDLLKERAGAKTGLVAYAGSAHQVVPLTEDPDVLKPFLEGLDPSVMPVKGSVAGNALQTAQKLLDGQDEPGSILFMLDTLSSEEQTAIGARDPANSGSLSFWVFNRDTGGAAGLSGLASGRVVTVTADTRDVDQVIRSIDAAYQAALSQDEKAKWRDQGVLLAWPAALILLFWFRRGWSMRWSAIVFIALLSQPVDRAFADGWRDWFFTPDQQGQMAFDAKDFGRAAELFTDPSWKAYALYKSGKYEEAAELYAWQDSSEAALGEGMSLVKSRSYRDAIDAFQKAVDRDPSNEAARKNLELAKYILEYIERTREQSDTGEEAGIGADDTVYDNEAGRGTETQQQTGETMPETAEQWMRTVNTQTGDFLKSRFALENAAGPQ